MRANGYRNHAGRIQRLTRSPPSEWPIRQCRSDARDCPATGPPSVAPLGLAVAHWRRVPGPHGPGRLLIGPSGLTHGRATWQRIHESTNHDVGQVCPTYGGQAIRFDALLEPFTRCVLCAAGVGRGRGGVFRSAVGDPRSPIPDRRVWGDGPSRARPRGRQIGRTYIRAGDLSVARRAG